MLSPKTSLKPHSAKGARGFYWHIWCPWVASINSEFAKASLTGLGIISSQAALFCLGSLFCIMLVQLAEKHWLFPCSPFSSSSRKENMLALCPTNIIFVCVVFQEYSYIILTAYHEPCGQGQVSSEDQAGQDPGAVSHLGGEGGCPLVWLCSAAYALVTNTLPRAKGNPVHCQELAGARDADTWKSLALTCTWKEHTSS